MAEFKIVISDAKTGKSIQKELKGEDAKPLIGLKIGKSFKGEILDLKGYEFKITGGSDNSGFPMRKEIRGTRRVKVLAKKGVGFRVKKIGGQKSKSKVKGMRRRKSVAPNRIIPTTSQINVMITKYGSESLFEEKKSEEKAEKKEDKK